MSNPIDFQKVALETLEIERQALSVLAKQIDDRFSRACEIILKCKGRLVITGVNQGILAEKWQPHLPLQVRHHSLCTQVKRGMVI